MIKAVNKEIPLALTEPLDTTNTRALHFAVNMNHEEAVEYLLNQHGADPNIEALFPEAMLQEIFATADQNTKNRLAEFIKEKRASRESEATEGAAAEPSKKSDNLIPISAIELARLIDNKAILELFEKHQKTHASLSSDTTRFFTSKYDEPSSGESTDTTPPVNP